MNGYAKVDPASGAKLRGVPPDHQGDLDLREWRLLSAVAEGRDDNHAEVGHSVPAG